MMVRYEGQMSVQPTREKKKIARKVRANHVFEVVSLAIANDRRTFLIGLAWAGREPFVRPNASYHSDSIAAKDKHAFAIQQKNRDWPMEQTTCVWHLCYHAPANHGLVGQMTTAGQYKLSWSNLPSSLIAHTSRFAPLRHRGRWRRLPNAAWFIPRSYHGIAYIGLSWPVDATLEKG